MENLSALFSEKNENALKEKESLIEELHKQIGMLKKENDWLKKMNSSLYDKKQLIQSDPFPLSVSKKCQLLELSRGTFYYQPAQETKLNLELMN